MNYHSLRGRDPADLQPGGCTSAMVVAAEGAEMATGEAGTFGTLLRCHRQAAALSWRSFNRPGLQEPDLERSWQGTTAKAGRLHIQESRLILRQEVLAERAGLSAVAAARPERAAPFAAEDLVPLVERLR